MENAFKIGVSILKDEDEPDTFEELAPLPKMKSSSPDIKRDKYYRNEIQTPANKPNGPRKLGVKFGSGMSFGSMYENFNNEALGLNNSNL